MSDVAHGTIPYKVLRIDCLSLINLVIRASCKVIAVNCMW
jgi:hypothetical protein